MVAFWEALNSSEGNAKIKPFGEKHAIVLLIKIMLAGSYFKFNIIVLP